MKTQQWQLRKVTEPRTLADVESSREQPVLCWLVDGGFVAPVWINDHKVWRIDRDGMIVRCNGKHTDFSLYAQPSRPTRLEDVPDRRIVRAAAFSLGGVSMMHDALWFRCGGSWYTQASGAIGFDDDHCLMPGGGWQLTDHCVELVETEIGVL